MVATQVELRLLVLFGAQGDDGVGSSGLRTLGVLRDGG